MATGKIEKLGLVKRIEDLIASGICSSEAISTTLKAEGFNVSQPTVSRYLPDSPVFPKTKLILDKNNAFVADGIEPVCWKSANQIRKIFKTAFINAGIEYFHPHSFRITLGRLGEILCRTPEEFKALSQNLGHEHPLTTFNSYGYIDEYNQGRIIKNLSKNKNNEKGTLEEIKEFLKEFKKGNNLVWIERKALNSGTVRAQA